MSIFDQEDMNFNIVNLQSIQLLYEIPYIVSVVVLKVCSWLLNKLSMKKLSKELSRFKLFNSQPKAMRKILFMNIIVSQNLKYYFMQYIIQFPEKTLPEMNVYNLSRLNNCLEL